MYCRNCGNQLKMGERFCAKCGTKIEFEENNVVQSYQSQSIPNVGQLNGANFNINNKNSNKKIWIPLIIVVGCLIVIILVLLLYPNSSKTVSNPAVGVWDCKSFNNGNNAHLDFIVTMTLEKNNRFKWNKYNDGKDNYVVGNYEFKDLHKTNNSGTANYYSIKLIGDEYVDGGILQNKPYGSTYEMGIITPGNEAILANTQTYRMYYCYKK